MVYFIADLTHKVVKIGKAKNVSNRLAQIKTNYPYKLEVLLEIEGYEALEKSLHFKFRNFKLEGEWFELNQEILDFINSPVIEIFPFFKDYNDKVQYLSSLDNEIESLYKQGLSNIDISNTLFISIHKVRRIIKINKLSQYRVIKKSMPESYYYKANLKRRAKRDFKRNLITEQELNNILLECKNPYKKVNT